MDREYFAKLFNDLKNVVNVRNLDVVMYELSLYTETRLINDDNFSLQYHKTEGLILESKRSSQVIVSDWVNKLNKLYQIVEEYDNIYDSCCIGG